MSIRLQVHCPTAVDVQRQCPLLLECKETLTVHAVKEMIAVQWHLEPCDFFLLCDDQHAPFHRRHLSCLRTLKECDVCNLVNKSGLIDVRLIIRLRGGCVSATVRAQLPE